MGPAAHGVARALRQSAKAPALAAPGVGGAEAAAARRRPSRVAVARAGAGARAAPADFNPFADVTPAPAPAIRLRNGRVAADGRRLNRRGARQRGRAARQPRVGLFDAATRRDCATCWSRPPPCDPAARPSPATAAAAAAGGMPFEILLWMRAASAGTPAACAFGRGAARRRLLRRRRPDDARRAREVWRSSPDGGDRRVRVVPLQARRRLAAASRGSRSTSWSPLAPSSRAASTSTTASIDKLSAGAPRCARCVQELCRPGHAGHLRNRSEEDGVTS